jgi:hypothetical protein
MTDEQNLQARITATEDALAGLRAKLSAIKAGRVSVSYGHAVDQPLGVIDAPSINDIDITSALAHHLNERKRYNMVGNLKVWVNDDAETVRDFFVTEVRELRVSPF